MRRVLLALGLALITAQTAPAFEVEATQDFGPSAPLRQVSVLSTTDIDIMAPVITAYLSRMPGLGLRYVMASSKEVHRAISDEDQPFDLVISSAMDLQMKLANDGFARPLPSDLIAALPGWARWRNVVVSVAQEPAVLIVAPGAIVPGEEMPRSRRDLIALLRDNPERFRGRVGSYSPTLSGVGYLLGTQDARLSDTFWRLAEVMGRLDARLFCCSVDMIDEVGRGDLLLAYNVLGSYALANAQADVTVVELEDFTLTLLRTALVPRGSPNPDLAIDFLRHLLSAEGQALVDQGAGLPGVDETAFDRKPHLRPIRLDPGLLANLDSVVRLRFLAEWSAALEQD